MTGPGWRRAPDGQWQADAADAEQMRQLGVDLSAILAPGDLLLLSGPLGAGKTTFTQGLGEGLGVRGPVTSPTFVIARVHPGPRVNLVHVDAYRLAGSLDVDDLDLDADLESSVTVVEWGEGKVEGLAPDRLEVRIERPVGGLPGDSQEDAGQRALSVVAVGARWQAVELRRCVS